MFRLRCIEWSRRYLKASDFSPKCSSADSTWNHEGRMGFRTNIKLSPYYSTYLPVLRGEEWSINGLYSSYYFRIRSFEWKHSSLERPMADIWSRITAIRCQNRAQRRIIDAPVLENVLYRVGANTRMHRHRVNALSLFHWLSKNETHLNRVCFFHQNAYTWPRSSIKVFAHH